MSKRPIESVAPLPFRRDGSPIVAHSRLARRPTPVPVDAYENGDIEPLTDSFMLPSGSQSLNSSPSGMFNPFPGAPTRFGQQQQPTLPLAQSSSYGSLPSLSLASASAATSVASADPVAADVAHWESLAQQLSRLGICMWQFDRPATLPPRVAKATPDLQDLRGTNPLIAWLRHNVEYTLNGAGDEDVLNTLAPRSVAVQSLPTTGVSTTLRAFCAKLGTLGLFEYDHRVPPSPEGNQLLVSVVHALQEVRRHVLVLVDRFDAANWHEEARANASAGIESLWSYYSSSHPTAWMVWSSSAEPQSFLNGPTVSMEKVVLARILSLDDAQYVAANAIRRQLAGLKFPLASCNAAVTYMMPLVKAKLEGDPRIFSTAAAVTMWLAAAFSARRGELNKPGGVSVMQSEVLPSEANLKRSYDLLCTSRPPLAVMAASSSPERTPSPNAFVPQTPSRH
jgi:hypothetical protein